MSSVKRVRIESGSGGGRLSESKILESAEMLRGSRKRKDLVMFDIMQVESANRESEEKMQSQLEGLNRQTQNYEKRLRVLREQLKLKESTNQQRYRLRIKEMQEQFQRLKQLFDLFKLGIYLAKKDLARKASCYIALKKNAFQKAKLEIKQSYLRGRVMRAALDRLLTNHQKQSCLDFALKTYRAKLRGQCFLALKANAYQQKIQRIKDQIARTKPRVIDISKDPIFDIANAPINHTVKPILVQKQKRVQKKQKIKIVKRPKKKAPKINRKRQQIIFKAPPPVITQAQPQAVTLHLKVQQLLKKAQTTHKHHKCHKHLCSKHSPSPIRTLPPQAEKENAMQAHAHEHLHPKQSHAHFRQYQGRPKTQQKVFYPPTEMGYRYSGPSNVYAEQFPPNHRGLQQRQRGIQGRSPEPGSQGMFINYPGMQGYNSPYI